MMPSMMMPGIIMLGIMLPTWKASVVMTMTVIMMVMDMVVLGPWALSGVGKV